MEVLMVRWTVRKIFNYSYSFQDAPNAKERFRHLYMNESETCSVLEEVNNSTTFSSTQSQSKNNDSKQNDGMNNAMALILWNKR